MEQKRIASFRELKVYQEAFHVAMRVYAISGKFPRNEMYSMTDQMRRSSRSVCTNIAEGWRKRRYAAVFINKLTDAAQEAGETQVWLEFAQQCHYIENDVFQELDERCEYIFAMLKNMELKSHSFCK